MTDRTAAAHARAQDRFEEWLADHWRSGWARTFDGGAAALCESTHRRVDAVLGRAAPQVANRAWLCEAVRAWAPLEVLFPTRDYPGDSGVTGELPAYVAEIVQREYAHILAVARSPAHAIELLQADAQRLELQVSVANAMREVLGEACGSDDWCAGYTEASLAVAEHLHRQLLGLRQVLADSVIMACTARISQMQREFVQPSVRETMHLVATAPSVA
jgi:hypothetical protein